MSVLGTWLPLRVSCGVGTKKTASIPTPQKRREGGQGFGGLAPYSSKKKKNTSKHKAAEKPKGSSWQCASGCGACCKLDKGPAFPTPEEIFDDDPAHAELYKSMIGPDGWCVHYEHGSRTCSIYQERPFFCRVEPEVFQKLYGTGERAFNKEACRSCRDTITSVYGPASEELVNFNKTIRSSK